MLNNAHNNDLEYAINLALYALKQPDDDNNRQAAIATLQQCKEQLPHSKVAHCSKCNNTGRMNAKSDKAVIFCFCNTGQKYQELVYLASQLNPQRLDALFQRMNNKGAAA